MGVVLATGRRTVAAALRVMGLSAAKDFARYHYVLNHARWDSRAVSRKLLLMIVKRFAHSGPIVIGLDDTIERRWGPKISARAIYRDPVRSSRGHFVKTSGLRWLSVMAMVPVPWARRRWGLPFLTILAPSERWALAHGRRHKKLTDWARQTVLQTRRWLGKRKIVVVANSSFAALDLIAALHRTYTSSPGCGSTPICSSRRRRALAGKEGPAKKGRRLPKLCDVLKDKKTRWTRLRIPYWYGDERCALEIVTGTDGMASSGKDAGRDTLGARARSHRSARSAGFPLHRPRRVAREHPRLVRRRWSMETTFEEVAPTSASRRSDNGPTSPSRARRQRCSGCSRS